MLVRATGSPSSTMQTRRSRSKNAIAQLSSVLQPLVDSASLGACEVGRIAQTCKTMNEACLEDSIMGILLPTRISRDTLFL